MSKIISFSADNQFADNLDSLMDASGYQNRSRFLRDAANYFAEIQRRGELRDMKDDEVIEGHLVVYYQHGVEAKLLEIRHSHDLEITSYNHSCLTHSHTCVDVLHALGKAVNFRTAIDLLRNTPNVDKVTFISAPMREDGCC
jgi:metal-responsive CopG/Arc/MetJ family transcriptional regulator